MNSILNGKIYKHALDDWTVFWESKGPYRHWCKQIHPKNRKLILVVMLNPGSLSHDGKELTKDITLRILREVFFTTGFNPFVINLFDYAATSPDELFENWDKRDGDELIYRKLHVSEFSGVLYAYGDYETHRQYGTQVLERIKMVRNIFSSLKEVLLPTNSSCTPSHPIIWQLQKRKPRVQKIITHFFGNAT
jgi:hypothetical protein